MRTEEKEEDDDVSIWLTGAQNMRAEEDKEEEEGKRTMTSLYDCG